MRLAPLQQVEAALVKKLLPHGHVQLSGLTNPAQSLPIQQEISVNVNSSAGWKSTFSRLIGRDSCDSSDLMDWSDPDDPGVVLNACSEDMKRLWADPIVKKMLDIEKMRPEEMAGLYVFKPYLIRSDSDDYSSFLDALDRVTSLHYTPTDGKLKWLLDGTNSNSNADDILRARLKTLGVSEHRFTMKRGLCHDIS
jgi:hypothetical protein